MTWRAIETFDDDSTDDVLVSDGIYVVLAWRDRWTNGYWRVPSGGRLNPQPTHWQPKPAPPEIPDGHLADGTPIFHGRAVDFDEWTQQLGGGEVGDVVAPFEDLVGPADKRWDGATAAWSGLKPGDKVSKRSPSAANGGNSGSPANGPKTSTASSKL